MWCHTALRVRIASFDASVLFFWLFAILGFEYWKLAVAVLATIFSKVCDFYGYRPISAYRAFRFYICGLFGNARPALSKVEMRRYA